MSWCQCSVCQATGRKWIHIIVSICSERYSFACPETSWNYGRTHHVKSQDISLTLTVALPGIPGYVRYANDNIGINEETLDGNWTFYAFRRAVNGSKNTQSVISVEVGCSRSVHVPPEFNHLKSVHMEIPKLELFEPDTGLTLKTAALDLAWITTECRTAANTILQWVQWKAFPF